MSFGPTRLVESSRKHILDAGETYWEHLRFAVAVGAMMIAAGFACLLHALIPGLCRDTASRTIARLDRLVRDRSTLDRALAEAAETVAFALLLAMSAAIAAIFWMLGAKALVAVPITLLALAFPAAILASNPDLADAAPGTAAEPARPIPRSG